MLHYTGWFPKLTRKEKHCTSDGGQFSSKRAPGKAFDTKRSKRKMTSCLRLVLHFLAACSRFGGGDLGVITKK